METTNVFLWRSFISGIITAQPTGLGVGGNIFCTAKFLGFGTSPSPGIVSDNVCFSEFLFSSTCTFAWPNKYLVWIIILCPIISCELYLLYMPVLFTATLLVYQEYFSICNVTDVIIMKIFCLRISLLVKNNFYLAFWSYTCINIYQWIISWVTILIVDSSRCLFSNIICLICEL